MIKEGFCNYFLFFKIFFRNYFVIIVIAFFLKNFSVFNVNN